METENQEIIDSLHNFMKRDYSKDVEELNLLLAKSNSADLRPESPPIPFTENPWSKVKGECTLLVGINPKWHEPGSKTGQFESEISESISLINRFRDGDEDCFSKYLDQRKNYFREGFEYGGHFTYIANRFIETGTAPINIPCGKNMSSIWISYLGSLIKQRALAMKN